MSYLIIVSNRGPFSFSDALLSQAEACLENGRAPEGVRFGEGGLVQAMSGLLRPGTWTTTWLGASMGNRDIEVARGHYTWLFEKMKRRGLAPEQFPYIDIKPDTRMRFMYKDFDFYMRFVFFDTKHMQGYYSKFANGFLWPLMHLTREPLFYKKTGVFPRPQFSKNDFVQYISSGVTFANTIIDEVNKIRKSDGNDIVIWNQDYHLMRTSEVYHSLLDDEGISQEERKRINLGQFIHTPFFDIHEIQGLIRQDKRERIKAQVYDPFCEDIETTLKKLTWGMLGNDFIGFHTKEYCDHFLEAVEEWFPVTIRVNGHHYEILHQQGVTTIGALPIGLDVDRILSEVTDDKHLHYPVGTDELSRMLHQDKEDGKHIVGGLERCDYTKGLIERLDIYHTLCCKLKESGNDSKLYQITSPSRTENPNYRNLMKELKSKIDQLNQDLPNDPIVHLDYGISPPQNYRFMKNVDIMLVTPLEDGMNLVAFEYILSQKYKPAPKRGLLVLGNSGAARVLRQKGFGSGDGVVFINALDPKGAGEVVAQAVRSGSRISDRVIAYVEQERRVDDWADQNIQAILGCRKQN